MMMNHPDPHRPHPPRPCSPRTRRPWPGLLGAALLLLPVLGAALELYVQDVSLTALRGTNYEVGHPQRWVGTFEYLNVNSLGDVFFFADHLYSDNGERETYAELQPRLALADLSATGLFKRLYLATQMEISENGNNYLIGPGLDLQVPGLAFLQLNFYRRFNEKGKNNWQLTPVWAAPFQLGQTQWLFDGFIDWTDAVAGENTSFNLTAQLKLDIAPYLKRNKPVYIGVEYTYWLNKFRIPDVDENNPNLLLKVHF